MRINLAAAFFLCFLLPGAAAGQETDRRSRSNDPWVRNLPDAEELSSGSLIPRVHGEPPAEGEGAGEEREADAAAQAESAGPPPHVVETEPNDTREQAQAVPASVVIEGRIEPVADSDWYALRVQRRGTLQVRYARVPAGVTPRYRLYRAEGNALTPWIQPKTAGSEALERVIDLKEVGLFQLNVIDDDNKSTSNSTYELVLRYRPEDTQEPNDKYEQATLLRSGMPIRASFLPRGDIDFYSFRTERKGIATLFVDDVPEGMEFLYRLLDPDRRVLAGWDSIPVSEGRGEPQELDLPGPGTYTVFLRDGESSTRAFETCRLWIDVILGDSFEPNDTYEQATPLQLGMPIRASFLPLHDIDYYSFRTERKGVATLFVDDVPEGMEFRYRLFGPEKHALTGWHNIPESGSHSEPQHLKIPGPGTYTLLTRDAKGSIRAFDPYRLRIDFTTGDSR